MLIHKYRKVGKSGYGCVVRTEEGSDFALVDADGSVSIMNKGSWVLFTTFSFRSKTRINALEMLVLTGIPLSIVQEQLETYDL